MRLASLALLSFPLPLGEGDSRRSMNCDCCYYDRSGGLAVCVASTASVSASISSSRTS
jgi:hypothetical protein